MSAVRKETGETGKRAHVIFSNTLSLAHTPTYYSFISIFVCSISRDNSPIQVQKAGRFFPLLVASFSACFSSTSRSLCHSTSTVAYFLQIHFLIGAAERRCCYAQSTEACAENTTHRKRWFVMGVVCGGATEPQLHRTHLTDTTSHRHQHIIG